jgi:NAD(P)-dependent dehydrogenase (short-subunit alcohol dehydrogenase family)
MFSLKGKTAIVTGAGRGLGAQIAKGLARMGAFVFCVGRNAEPLLELCTTIAETDGASEPLIFDVANEGDAVIAVNHVIEARVGSISSSTMSEHAIDGHLGRSNSTIFAASLKSTQSRPSIWHDWLPISWSNKATAALST